MKKILTSECLYGGRIVRYDAGDCTETNTIYLKWKEEGRLVPVCPEVFGGLPTPRPEPAQDLMLLPSTLKEQRKHYGLPEKMMLPFAL